ncbi:MAG TPA: leukotriene A4 hydrolase C-terminal domain-containing protein, partial [Saprospiraceae bacterium]|nr:leukotriene A4 hydrolase C-terminal domain-containing protein [Saprospiraceae bacterium]
KLYQWSKSGNNEIKAAWIEKATITGHGKAILDDTSAFLESVGRRKYLEPIYTALKTKGLGVEAKEIYAKARPLYHYVAVRTIDELLNFHPK